MFKTYITMCYTCRTITVLLRIKLISITYGKKIRMAHAIVLRDHKIKAKTHRIA